MSEDFGSYLKHERELRGVPLDDIAESTKISVRFLRALEEGRFEDLPGEVFIKGFIRSYGQAIGSNVDELLAAYHESGAKHQGTGPPSTEISPSREKTSKNLNPSVFPTKALLGFGAALLIIGGGVYWFTSNKAENSGLSPQESRLETSTTVDNSLPEVKGDAESTFSEEPAIPAPETETPEPAPAAAAPAPEPRNSAATLTPAETPTEAPGPQESVKNTFTVSENIDTIKDIQDQTVPTEPPAEMAMGEPSLRLEIRVTENSWFNLRIDDQRDQDFILPTGGSKTIKAATAIVVTIGNRRATQMILNGQQLDLPESPDNVIRNLTVNAEQLN